MEIMYLFYVKFFKDCVSIQSVVVQSLSVLQHSYSKYQSQAEGRVSLQA